MWHGNVTNMETGKLAIYIYEYMLNVLVELSTKVSKWMWMV